jgi:hypothetical protein
MSDCESRGLRRTEYFPIWWLKWRFWILAQLWQHSTGRILAREIGKIPRRMKAILQKKYPGSGIPLAEAPSGYEKESWDWKYTFQRDCTSCIQQQQAEYNWASALDREMVSKAFQRGAEWGLRNACSQKSSAGL